jgi:phosphoribosylanthranilate isomerase
VKICGVTTADDARRAVDLGAWALGMIFYRPSPRRCRQDEAAAIAAELRRRVELVGVFVNETLDRVAQIADRVGLTALQLHGDEGPSFCAEAARRTGCKVIKARQVGSLADLRGLEPFHVDYHLLDAPAHQLRGGTGRTWDWGLVRERRSAEPLLVSGGLTPDNVAQAIAATGPYGVDVASGVETRPGRKDPAKLEAFFAAVQEAATPNTASGSGPPQPPLHGSTETAPGAAAASTAARPARPSS